MPSVNKQQLIAVLPEYSNVIRGQQDAATITLHKDYVGNSINIGSITNVKVEYLNNDLVAFKTQEKTLGTLTYGSGESRNAISVSMTGDETLALTLDANNINGEVWVRLTVTEGISPVALPLLKLGNVYDAGANIGDMVASRYGMPSTVYGIKDLGSEYDGSNPAQGQIFFNSDLPSQVSKIKIAVKDDKGFRNEYLENLLEKRITVDGNSTNIFFTNTRNNSEYAVYKIASWNWVNVTDLDSANPNSEEDDDAIELYVEYDSNSTTPGETYKFTIGDDFGLFYETYNISAPSNVIVNVNGQAFNDIRTITMTGGLSASREVGTNEIQLQYAEAATSSGTSGSSGSSGETGAQGIVGERGIQGEVGATGEKGRPGDTGADGADGAQGNLGAQGPVGAFGQKGEVGVSGERYNTTSGNQLGIGWHTANVTLNTEPYLAWKPGQIVRIQRSAVVAQWQISEVVSYDSITGDLTIAPPSSFNDPMPIGTYSYSWKLYLAGLSGVNGTDGVDGVDGAQGAQGATGVTGDAGTNGTDGADSTVAGPAGTDGVDGAKGDQGDQGHQGDKGDQGFKGQTGAGGLAGTDGVDGVDGVDGAAGAQGPQGYKGSEGAYGNQGNKGNDGADGTIGEKGRPGDTGLKGDQGDKGVIGHSGMDGFDGNDGVQGIRGEKGDDGTTGDRGEKGTSGNQGAQGSKGQIGNQGAQGATGADGADGIVGEQGIQGDAGQKGDTGAQGGAGSTGPQGAQGATGAASNVAGPAGQKGETGPQGNPGNNGNNGADGAAGNQGAQGAQGATGANGNDGVKGDTGETGSAGNDGLAGSTGPQGPQGASGVKGDNGDAGPVGPQGNTGNGGLNGTPGADSTVAGPAGQKGETGTQGNPGNAGAKGDQGAAGAEGTKGDTGDTGSQGPQGATGANGNNGADSTVAGPTGPQGNPGIDGASGATGPKGLVGNKGDAGADSTVAGPTGPQGNVGPGITFKGDVALVTDLPVGSNSTGDAYIVQSNDSMWVWNGTQWVDGGSIQGAAGQKGDAGVKGDDGAAGPQGNPGADSTVAGPTGPQGNPGADSTVAGPTGPQGNPGADSTVAGPAGQKGETGADSTVAGPAGQKGDAGSTGVTGPTGPQGASGAGGGGGVKYLLRLEYDVNETLVTNNTTFVTATGFATAGASVVSQTANAGSNSGHNVTLNFSDTNPPTSIIGYGWNPATGNYTAAAYDRDTKQVQYEVGLGAFTNQSTTDGGSGDNGQWAGSSFSGAGSYNIKLDVDQSALTYGNAVAGAFGNPSKFPHAYLVISF